MDDWSKPASFPSGDSGTKLGACCDWFVVRAQLTKPVEVHSCPKCGQRLEIQSAPGGNFVKKVEPADSPPAAHILFKFPSDET